MILPLFVWFWRLQIADADGIVNCNSEGFFLNFFLWENIAFFFLLGWSLPIRVLGKL